MAQFSPPPPLYQPHYIAAHHSVCHDSVADQVIEHRISNVTYTILAGSTVTLCTVILDTGYSVWGGSTCTDPRAFDPVLGEQFAYKEAFRKLRTLFGFLAIECRHLYTANTIYLRGKP